MLQCSKDDHGQERERLETDLDQIVYIIKNKSNLKVRMSSIQQDLKKLVAGDK